ncbi:MAG: hypothetical protein A2076_18255 [Geobacteraceae bacterium GWC2_53_11]|nr:MAG: hypothetical protein A2076_18255 [Geobacteraceae bacterium GWC2_53_11]
MNSATALRNMVLIGAREIRPKAYNPIRQARRPLEKGDRGKLTVYRRIVKNILYCASIGVYNSKASELFGALLVSGAPEKAF